MKVLLNYSIEEKSRLSIIAFLLKKAGLEAVGSAKPLYAGELVSLAAKAGCKAVIIANETTLRNMTDNPKATLDAYRGSMLTLSSDITALVINKLAHIHTISYGSFILNKDLAKLDSLKNGSSTKKLKFVFKVLQNQSEYPAILEEMSTSILTSYDIETKTVNVIDKDTKPAVPPENWKAGDTLITCASWTCLLPSGLIKTWTLPLIDFLENHWHKVGEYENAIKFLQDANKLPTPKVMHNGMYDCTHSIVYHAEPHNFCLDTMALAHAEYTELPKSLDFVASITLDDYVQWKDEAASASMANDIRAYWAYNAKDTWYTLRIAIEQLRTMPVYAKHNFADKFKLVYPSLYCSFEGFRVDVDKQNEIRVGAQEQLEAHHGLLKTYFADPGFNPGSWQQVEKYIYKVIGGVKPKIGKSSSATDAKNLNVVADQHPLLARVIDSILKYKTNQKAIGTYYNFLKKNNRLLWALNPFGTESERMACNSSSFWCGTQVQNIPKYGKAFLIADDGYEIVEVDNKQSEGRCTAFLAQDEALIKAIEDPVYDFYKTLGTLFFNIPYAEVTDFFRNKVLKRIVHGTNYMMGAGTFKDNVGTKILHETSAILGYKLVPKPSAKNKREKTIVGFCKELLECYHKPFPRVREWYKEVYKEVATSSMLVSPLGHVRYFFGDITKDHTMLRSAVSHAPQNLSVHILNIGFWKIYKKMVVQPVAPLAVGDFRLKAQIHDSILAQYRIELKDICVPMMMKLMDNPVEVHKRVLRIPVDAKTGTVWGKCEDYKQE